MASAIPNKSPRLIANVINIQNDKKFTIIILLYSGIQQQDLI